MKPGALWPIAIVTVLVITVAANVVLIVAASNPNGAVVEPDYYRKAVAFDSTMAERAADARLGWRIESRIGVPSASGARLEAQLLDAAGAPLEGARVRVVAVHNLDAGHPIEGVLVAAGEGRYAATLPLVYGGRWELRFEVERSAQRFHAKRYQDTGTLP